MYRAILMMLLAVVSSGAMAEWVYFSESIKANIYINPNSIQKSGNTVKMWELYDYKEAQKRKAGITHSYKEQNEYKWKEKQTRLTFQVLYSESMGEGKIVQTYDEPDKWVPVIPDSIAEKSLEFAFGTKQTFIQNPRTAGIEL